MRTLLIALLGLALTTTAQAQTATLLATRTDASASVAPAPAPNHRPEARTLITELVMAELQTPAIQKYKPELVYIDLAGSAATARVQYNKIGPQRVYFYHLRETDGQWHIVSRDTNPKMQ
jgi:hypothetical protein